MWTLSSGVGVQLIWIQVTRQRTMFAVMNRYPMWRQTSATCSANFCTYNLAHLFLGKSYPISSVFVHFHLFHPSTPFYSTNITFTPLYTFSGLLPAYSLLISHIKAAFVALGVYKLILRLPFSPIWNPKNLDRQLLDNCEIVTILFLEKCSRNIASNCFFLGLFVIAYRRRLRFLY